MKNRLPDLSTMTSSSLTLEPVFINGQKILFDKKVKLMPIVVEQKLNEDERI